MDKKCVVIGLVSLLTLPLLFASTDMGAVKKDTWVDVKTSAAVMPLDAPMYWIELSQDGTLQIEVTDQKGGCFVTLRVMDADRNFHEVANGGTGIGTGVCIEKALKRGKYCFRVESPGVHFRFRWKIKEQQTPQVGPQTVPMPSPPQERRESEQSQKQSWSDNDLVGQWSLKETSGKRLTPGFVFYKNGSFAAVIDGEVKDPGAVGTRIQWRLDTHTDPMQLDTISTFDNGRTRVCRQIVRFVSNSEMLFAANGDDPASRPEGFSYASPDCGIYIKVKLEAGIMIGNAQQQGAQEQAAPEQPVIDQAAREVRAEADQLRRSEEAARLEAEKSRREVLSSASQDSRWVNSLGMKFVPVPGTKVLFCVWETRVQDYGAYAKANSGVSRRWEDPTCQGQKVTPSEDCPVVNVSWDDARAFCRWLTEKERQAGLISENKSYRLPWEAEWSQAVGNTKYPWGEEWPPTGRAGNYADAAAKRAFSYWSVVEGYDDGYPTTAPVGSFDANKFGIYDLGGNVFEWCEDWYDANHNSRVVRGAAWDSNAPDNLLSSYRYNDGPDTPYNNVGFRCVLAVGSPP